jgi:hypothetical protein
MQSSLPLWLFEHSGPITLCAYLDASIPLCCTTCAWWEHVHVYKYGGIIYLDAYQAALTRRWTSKHACLQIVLYWVLCGVVNGWLLVIMQSSLPLWLFEHSGPITLCTCLDASIPSCCTTCAWWEHTHVYKYRGIMYLDAYQAALTRCWPLKHACLQIVLLRSFTSLLLSTLRSC